MTQEELQNLLDGLDKGPLGTRKEYEWDSAIRLSNYATSNNPMKDPEIARKNAISRVGSKKSKVVKDRISALNKINHAGRKNGHYGKGDQYKVTTPEQEIFIGTPLDIKEKYDLQPANLREYAIRNKPCTKGKFKGYLFQIYQP